MKKRLAACSVGVCLMVTAFVALLNAPSWAFVFEAVTFGYGAALFCAYARSMPR